MPINPNPNPGGDEQIEIPVQIEGEEALTDLRGEVRGFGGDAEAAAARAEKLSAQLAAMRQETMQSAQQYQQIRQQGPGFMDNLRGMTEELRQANTATGELYRGLTKVWDSFNTFGNVGLGAWAGGKLLGGTAGGVLRSVGSSLMWKGGLALAGVSAVNQMIGEASERKYGEVSELATTGAAMNVPLATLTAFERAARAARVPVDALIEGIGMLDTRVSQLGKDLSTTTYEGMRFERALREIGVPRPQGDSFMRMPQDRIRENQALLGQVIAGVVARTDNPEERARLFRELLGPEGVSYGMQMAETGITNVMATAIVPGRMRPWGATTQDTLGEMTTRYHNLRSLDMQNAQMQAAYEQDIKSYIGNRTLATILKPVFGGPVSETEARQIAQDRAIKDIREGKVTAEEVQRQIALGESTTFTSAAGRQAGATGFSEYNWQRYYDPQGGIGARLSEMSKQNLVGQQTENSLKIGLQQLAEKYKVDIGGGSDILTSAFGQMANTNSRILRAIGIPMPNVALDDYAQLSFKDNKGVTRQVSPAFVAGLTENPEGTDLRGFGPTPQMLQGIKDWAEGTGMFHQQEVEKRRQNLSEPYLRMLGKKLELEQLEAKRRVGWEGHPGENLYQGQLWDEYLASNPGEKARWMGMPESMASFRKLNFEEEQAAPYWSLMEMDPEQRSLMLQMQLVGPGRRAQLQAEMGRRAVDKLARENPAHATGQTLQDMYTAANMPNIWMGRQMQYMGVMGAGMSAMQLNMIGAYMRPETQPQAFEQMQKIQASMTDAYGKIFQESGPMIQMQKDMQKRMFDVQTAMMQFQKQRMDWAYSDQRAEMRSGADAQIRLMRISNRSPEFVADAYRDIEYERADRMMLRAAQRGDLSKGLAGTSQTEREVAMIREQADQQHRVRMATIAQERMQFERQIASLRDDSDNQVAVRRLEGLALPVDQPYVIEERRRLLLQGAAARFARRGGGQESEREFRQDVLNIEGQAKIAAADREIMLKNHARDLDVQNRTAEERHELRMQELQGKRFDMAQATYQQAVREAEREYQRTGEIGDLRAKIQDAMRSKEEQLASMEQQRLNNARQMASSLYDAMRRGGTVGTTDLLKGWGELQVRSIFSNITGDLYRAATRPLSRLVPRQTRRGEDGHLVRTRWGRWVQDSIFGAQEEDQIHPDNEADILAARAASARAAQPLTAALDVETLIRQQASHDAIAGLQPRGFDDLTFFGIPGLMKLRPNLDQINEDARKNNPLLQELEKANQAFAEKLKSLDDKAGIGNTNTTNIAQDVQAMKNHILSGASNTNGPANITPAVLAQYDPNFKNNVFDPAVRSGKPFKWVYSDDTGWKAVDTAPGGALPNLNQIFALPAAPKPNPASHPVQLKKNYMGLGMGWGFGLEAPEESYAPLDEDLVLRAGINDILTTAAHDQFGPPVPGLRIPGHLAAGTNLPLSPDMQIKGLVSAAARRMPPGPDELDVYPPPPVQDNLLLGANWTPPNRFLTESTTASPLYSPNWTPPNPFLLPQAQTQPVAPLVEPIPSALPTSLLPTTGGGIPGKIRGAAGLFSEIAGYVRGGVGGLLGGGKNLLDRIIGSMNQKQVALGGIYPQGWMEPALAAYGRWNASNNLLAQSDAWAAEHLSLAYLQGQVGNRAAAFTPMLYGPWMNAEQASLASIYSLPMRDVSGMLPLSWGGAPLTDDIIAGYGLDTSLNINGKGMMASEAAMRNEQLSSTATGLGIMGGLVAAGAGGYQGYRRGGIGGNVEMVGSGITGIGSGLALAGLLGGSKALMAAGPWGAAIGGAIMLASQFLPDRQKRMAEWQEDIAKASFNKQFSNKFGRDFPRQDITLDYATGMGVDYGMMGDPRAFPAKLVTVRERDYDPGKEPQYPDWYVVPGKGYTYLEWDKAWGFPSYKNYQQMPEEPEQPGGGDKGGGGGGGDIVDLSLIGGPTGNPNFDAGVAAGLPITNGPDKNPDNGGNRIGLNMRGSQPIIIQIQAMDAQSLNEFAMRNSGTFADAIKYAIVNRGHSLGTELAYNAGLGA